MAIPATTLVPALETPVVVPALSTVAPTASSTSSVPPPKSNEAEEENSEDDDDEDGKISLVLGQDTDSESE
jgi:hypothetical protein